MSYETLVKETQTLTYEEQVDLLAYLANSIQRQNDYAQKNDNVARQLDALDKLSGLFTDDEMKNVDKSIAKGIKIKEIAL